MKKSKLLLTIISILLVLSVMLPMTVSAAEDTYSESYLTYRSGMGSQITNHVNYVDKMISGASSIVIEAKLGENPDSVLAVALGDNKTTTMYSKFSVCKAITFGSYLKGYTYFDSSDKFGSNISEIYNDGISEKTLFYSKTTYKIDISKNGTVDVYAKLTETKEQFLADGGTEETYNLLSRDFIKLYSLENFYSESFLNSGYYVAFNVKHKILTEDVVLYHLTILDGEGGILFADNFTHYGLEGTNPTNGYYAIPSNDLRAQIGTSIVTTIGDEYIVPQFNLDSIPRTVDAGATVDLTPEMVNFNDTYSVTVTKGDATVLDDTNKFTFTEQGYYTVEYQSAGGVYRKMTVLAINASTQPTVELRFDNESIGDRMVGTNYSVENGFLNINNGSFMTKGMSEAFIYTIKVSSLSEGADLSIVFGKDGDKCYSLKLTKEGVSFYDYEGQETKYECKDLVTELLNNRPVKIRVTLMGQKLSFSATFENEQRELLGVELFTIEDIVYVGQIGVEVSNGSASIDSMQFVNLTSVKNDNTTTEVPEKPVEDSTPETPDKPDEDNGKVGFFEMIANFFRRIFNFLFGWMKKK